MTVRYVTEKCDQSPFCPAARACPTGAMYIDRKVFRPKFDAEKCTGCAVCVQSCPHGAMIEV